MHAIPFNSPQQVTARIVARCQHSQPHRDTRNKDERRRNKWSLREYRRAVAAVVSTLMLSGCDYDPAYAQSWMLALIALVSLGFLIDALRTGAEQRRMDRHETRTAHRRAYRETN